MREYQTEQRKRLLAFFLEHPDRQFTIAELAASLSGISLSAIYRNINQMVAEGTVQRFQKEGSRKSLYQYFGHSACADNLHLKCSECGKILHMDPQAMDVVTDVVRRTLGFQIDKSKTVLFGSCASCE